MTKTRILYNGRCPICRAEISRYARSAQTLGAPLEFEDLHDADLSTWHLNPDQAKRRMHAQLPDGRRISGVAAFAAIWDHLPRLRWLARTVRLPVVGTLAGLAYDHLAAPVIYRLYRHREKLGNADHPS